MLTNGFKGAIGVKTGFTSKAGRTFVGTATRKGHTLIFVGMGIKETSMGAAEAAIDWGFKNLNTIKPIGTLVEPLSPLPSLSQTSTTANQVELAATTVTASPEATQTTTTDLVARKAINQAR